MKPLWRSTATGLPTAASIAAILTVLPFIAAAAYLPISSPATKLLVAKSASEASWGCSGESRAMTSTPASRAFLIAGMMALASLGVIRMPFTPALTIFSIAVTWPSLSPSKAPAAVRSVAPLALASASAPSFILTKKGLVSVLVIRPTLTSPAAPEAGAALVAAGVLPAAGAEVAAAGAWVAAGAQAVRIIARMVTGISELNSVLISRL